MALLLLFVKVKFICFYWPDHLFQWRVLKSQDVVLAGGYRDVPTCNYKIEHKEIIASIKAYTRIRRFSIPRILIWSGLLFGPEKMIRRPRDIQEMKTTTN